MSNKAPAGLQLPNAPAQYSQQDQALLRAALAAADRDNAKQNQEANMKRLVLTDTVTGTRYNVTIASGALTLVAL